MTPRDLDEEEAMVGATGGELVSASHGHRWTRTAWIATVLTPAGVLLGFAVAFVIGDWLGVDLFESSSLTFGENTLIYGPASLIWMAAPLVGLLAGIRAAKDGSRSGLVAAIVAGVALLVMLAASVQNLTCCWT